MAWEGPPHVFNVNGFQGHPNGPNKQGMAYLKIFPGCEHCNIGWDLLESLACAYIFSLLLVSRWGRQSLKGYEAWTSFQSLLLCQQPLCVRPIKFVCTWQQWSIFAFHSVSPRDWLLFGKALWSLPFIPCRLKTPPFHALPLEHGHLL